MFYVCSFYQGHFYISKHSSKILCKVDQNNLENGGGGLGHRCKGNF